MIFSIFWVLTWLAFICESQWTDNIKLH
uniref:Uncharacterized protein n=1 Tax=Arundo donax TaxID=35708 RepID=A0A0A9EHR9_ARUDO